jgi:hypothetical protein
MFGANPNRLNPNQARQLVSAIREINETGNVSGTSVSLGIRSQIQQFNAGIGAEIRQADNVVRSGLGLSEDVPVTAERMAEFRRLEQSREAARAAERALDGARKLPSLVAPVIVAVFGVRFGPEAAAEAAVVMSPVGDAEEIVEGVPEAGRRASEIVEHTAAEYDAWGNNVRQRRENTASNDYGVGDALDTRLEERMNPQVRNQRSNARR